MVCGRLETRRCTTRQVMGTCKWFGSFSMLAPIQTRRLRWMVRPAYLLLVVEGTVVLCVHCFKAAPTLTSSIARDVHHSGPQLSTGTTSLWCSYWPGVPTSTKLLAEVFTAMQLHLFTWRPKQGMLMLLDDSLKRVPTLTIKPKYAGDPDDRLTGVKRGESPLIAAAQQNQICAVRVLVDAHANVELSNTVGVGDVLHA
ncbi:hypothetical protein ACHHYP_07355 [Achlya hypogyna]|uniref:Uncharacterized protein n=1 Tax=Achlya hypogyna TaxID=1202772 RepID=A0A1V9ZLY6_ACHHY|nr:hypothetical protein ACHHYP_07355 [Achlya hypogyna]